MPSDFWAQLNGLLNLQLPGPDDKISVSAATFNEGNCSVFNVAAISDNNFPLPNDALFNALRFHSSTQTNILMGFMQNHIHVAMTEGDVVRLYGLLDLLLQQYLKPQNFVMRSESGPERLLSSSFAGTVDARIDMPALSQITHNYASIQKHPFIMESKAPGYLQTLKLHVLTATLPQRKQNVTKKLRWYAYNYSSRHLIFFDGSDVVGIIFKTPTLDLNDIKSCAVEVHHSKGEDVAQMMFWFWCEGVSSICAQIYGTQNPGRMIGSCRRVFIPWNGNPVYVSQDGTRHSNHPEGWQYSYNRTKGCHHFTHPDGRVIEEAVLGLQI